MLAKKRLLASVRKGDFTHPGEIEAIDLLMEHINKPLDAQVLDVGCGLGGTAHYFKQKGWGSITGIDIDPNAVSYATAHYPGISFFESDVQKLEQFFPEKRFDLMYLFSSFYSFKDQKACLLALNKIAQKDCQLLIFDYATERQYAGENPFNDDTIKPFHPINSNAIGIMLKETGWSLQEEINLTTQFKKWYESLLVKMEENKSTLIEEFSEPAYSINEKRFKTLLQYIGEDKLGGKLICAVKID